MVLKNEILKLGDKEIKIKQLSFAGQMRLEKKGKERGIMDVLEEVLENLEVLETLDKDEGLKLMEAINKLHNWGEEKEKETDFQEPTPPESGK